MPDFDIDFCRNVAGEVLNYVRAKYGRRAGPRPPEKFFFPKIPPKKNVFFPAETGFWGASARVVPMLGRVSRCALVRLTVLAKMVPTNPAVR